MPDSQSNMPLQSGTYIFVFTDLANSTHLAFSLPPVQWQTARDNFFALQDRLSRDHHRVWLSPRGDGKFLVFAESGDAARFSAALLNALGEVDWGGVPIAIRVGMASGHADFLPTEQGGVTEDFVGTPLNLAARICAAARPGEALLASQLCAHIRASGLLEMDFADLGEVELSGLPPERVFRLVAPGLQQDFPPLAQRGNLNRYEVHSQYFGEEQTVAEALGHLAGGQPVLTLLGDPGQGKTRLALEVGRQARDLFQDGIWFVPLEHVRQGDLVAEAVATELELSAFAGQDIGAAIVTHLKTRRTLLILDNCEQLLAGGDDGLGLLDFVEDIVRGCPKVRVLTTSRVPLDLGVGLERMLRLPELPVPPPEAYSDLAALRRYPSAALLCDRLSLASGGRFVLDAATAPYVVSLCRSLDGVPLYLELAAGQLARSRTLPQISSDVYEMLQTRDRGYADRQRTLDKLMDFSCDLLTETRDFFYQLGVFTGDFRAEAAVAICDQVDAEEFLQTLMLHSLVKSDLGDNYTALAPSYRLLQAPAAFGRHRLGDQLNHWQRRHAEYYLKFARIQDARLKGPEQNQAANALAEAQPNLRGGMDWALDTGESQLAGEYGAALGRVLFIRSLTIEGRSRMTAALEAARQAGDTTSEACVLSWSATFQRQRGDLVSARAMEEEALRLHRVGGDKQGEAASLNALSVIEQREGNLEAARALSLDSLSLFHDLGDSWGEAQCLYHLGEDELRQGIPTLALHYHEQSLALRELIGDQRGLGNSLSALGRIAFRASEYDRARHFYENALLIKRELTDPEGEATCLYTLGIISQVTGDSDRAQEQLGAALVTYQRLGLPAYESECLRLLAEVALERRDVSHARAFAEQALHLCQDLNDRRGVANALMVLADVAGKESDYTDAERLASEALEIRRTLNIPDLIADSLHTLGRLAIEKGALSEAQRYLLDSLEIFHQNGRRHGVAMTMSAYGIFLQKSGDVRYASLLLSAACALFEELGVQLDHGTAMMLQEIHAGLTDIQAEAWKKEAAALGLEGAVQLALAGADVND
jgi:predicted ATPase/class 3 adenylate cyclase